MKLDGVHVLPPKEQSELEHFRNEMDGLLDAIDLPDALPETDAGAPVNEEDLGE